MDTFALDIERFKSEVVAARHAQTQQQIWNQESSRRAENLRALVQLISSAARESGRSIPQAVAELASQYGMSHVIAGIPIDTVAPEPTLSPESAEPTTESNAGDDQFKSTWIVTQVINSGVNGISPPEILRLAKAAGISMHHNYPYNVLRHVVQQGRLVKVGNRYLKKS